MRVTVNVHYEGKKGYFYILECDSPKILINSDLNGEFFDNKYSAFEAASAKAGAIIMCGEE